MDFFEAQARAQKQTSRLIVLFSLAVAGTIAAGYLAAIVVLRQAGPRVDGLQTSYRNMQRSGRWIDRSIETRWWDPSLFAMVSFGTIVVVACAALYKWYQFKAGGAAVAETVGGRPIDPNTSDLNERRLLNIVEEMAIASGTSVPTVFLLPDEAGINAFAAGLTTGDAIVAVSRGAIEKLTRDELQGVIGHEFSHILNGDMRMNLRIAAIVFGILVLGLLGRGILWSMRGMRGSRGRGSGGVIAAAALIGLALVIIGYVGYFFGRLIQAAVSRQREYLADASAVQFTRNPAGITGALKKIGGYTLGGLMSSNKATTIGHFFFAQAFRSGVTGLWATHPPLVDRIRAIEPTFDGRMFEPPQLVDVRTESFRDAALHAGRHPGDAATAISAFSSRADAPKIPASQKIAFHPASAIAAIGQLDEANLGRARTLLGGIPESLAVASRQPDSARALIYGLLLDSEVSVRQRQQAAIARRDAAALGALTPVEQALRTLAPEQKLPLVQLCLPALREVTEAQLPAFLDTLDELVHADAQVSIFEFALQKLLIRTLNLAPAGAARVQFHSASPLAGEIATLLSAMARAAVTDPTFAPQAFAAGAEQFRLLADRLRYRSDSDLAQLDSALDRLALASPPVKQQILFAAARLVAADGQVLVSELELLRAVAATLDCPLPPLGIAAGV